MTLTSPFLRLLVVEDNASHLALVRRALSGLTPLEIDSATTLTEARSMIAGRLPDMALVDLGLPDGSGADLVEVAAGRFPVVVMTASRDEQVIVDLMRKGVMDFVVKSHEVYADLPHTLVRAHMAWRHVVERHRAEAALQRREAEYRFLVEHAADAILSVSIDGVITFASPAAKTVLGVGSEELVGAAVVDLVHPDDRPRFLATLHRCQTHREGGTTVEVRLASDTEERYLDVSYGIRTEADRDRVVLMFRDVTSRVEAEFERARLDSELRRAQRLNTVGTLASGIAHDFNNILSPILMCAQFLRDGMEEDDPGCEDADQIISASQRAAELVKRILLFAQGVPAESQPVDLPALAEEAMTLLAAGMGARLTLERDYADDVPPILGDTTQLHQMLMNLCTNAAQAIDGPGTISLSLDRVPEDPTIVRLRVRDTGPGMLPEVQERIFEPFFTTRNKKHNTGLGLAVTRRIVEDHGGTIACTSKIGRGTSFEILLPVARGEQKSASVRPPASERGRDGRVLLVDDEAIVRRATAVSLRRAGYEVVDVSSALDALRVLATDRAFDLVISDHMMRGMTGADFANELTVGGHQIPILLISGDVSAVPESLSPLIRATLPKPYDANQLVRAVDRVLVASPSAGPNGLEAGV